MLIVGSGMSYHAMGGFGRPESLAVSESFDDWLSQAVAATPSERSGPRLVGGCPIVVRVTPESSTRCR